MKKIKILGILSIFAAGILALTSCGASVMKYEVKDIELNSDQKIDITITDLQKDKFTEVLSHDKVSISIDSNLTKTKTVILNSADFNTGIDGELHTGITYFTKIECFPNTKNVIESFTFDLKSYLDNIVLTPDLMNRIETDDTLNKTFVFELTAKLYNGLSNKRSATFSYTDSVLTLTKK